MIDASRLSLSGLRLGLLSHLAFPGPGPPAQLKPPDVTGSTSSSQSRVLAPKKDPMGGFSRWFTLGDGGLVEQFEPDLTLEGILEKVFAD